MMIGLFALPILVWAISGNTTAHGEEAAARQPAKQPYSISELLLVRGKSRAEALQMALGSGAREVVIALWNVVDTRTESEDPVTFDTVEYHIVNGRVVETELRILRSSGQAFIKSIYDEVKAAGKIDRTKTTKHKEFLTIPLRDKRVLSVEMQRPSSGGRYPWFVRLRPGGSVAKPVSVSKPAKAASPPATGADAAHSIVIAGIRIPVSVSAEQLAAFLKPQSKLLQRIELLDVPISFGKGKVVRSERISYTITAGEDASAAEEDGAWGVGPGILGKLECWICEKDQDYEALMAFIKAFAADVRGRGDVVLSKNSFFVANITMPTTMPTRGKVSASFAISSPKLRADIERVREKVREGLFAKIKISVGPGNEDTDTPTTRPAKEKSDK